MATIDPNAQAVLQSLSNVLKVSGTIVATYGAAVPMASHLAADLTIGSGVILVLGPAIWDVYNAIKSYRTAKAVGVQAGINMTVQGKALAADDKTVITKFDAGPDSTPFKPVTLATADKIIQDFGSTAPIAKN